MEVKEIPRTRRCGKRRKRVRKLQQSWTSEQTHHLINAIQAREGLWNDTSNQYKDRSLREALWEDVAREMCMPRSEVSIKWDFLRSSYRAYYHKKVSTKKKQEAKTNFKMLKFLEPIMRTGAPTIINTDGEDSTDIFEKEYFETNELQLSPSPMPTHTLISAPISSPVPLRASSSTSLMAPSSSPLTSKPREKTPKSSEKRFENNEACYVKVVETALQTISAVTKNDSWDDLGNFVASNGREWAAENRLLANQFKIAVIEVVLNFHKNFECSL